MLSNALKNILAFSLVLFLLLSANTFSATITVNTAADSIIIDGSCSLREAIISANNDPFANILGECEPGSGPDEIVFDSSLNGTPLILSIAGIGEDISATGDLDIGSDITITGNGAQNTIIDGADIDRVIHVLSNGSATISGVTIQNGSTGEIGGGVFNENTLTINNSVIRDNEANAGGGINNFASMLTINNSLITNNRTIDAGFTNQEGAGIRTIGTVSIENSSITNNTTDPSSGSNGAGIYSSGTVDITNTTISGNSATSAGGIRNVNGTLNLLNVTITNNSTIGLSHFSFTGLDIVSLKNTIIAQNGTFDCGGDSPISSGNNIDSDNTCNLIDPSDMQNTDPMLGSLNNNGGIGETHLLLSGSPALDMGENTSCPPNGQRGTVRPQDGDDDGTATCDIGAIEMLLSELISTGGSSGGGSGCSLINSANSYKSSTLDLLIPIILIGLVIGIRRKQR